MHESADLLTRNYFYDLPNERIAQYPLSERDQSKILIYKESLISEGIFGNLADFLPHGSILVRNNTKVIPARLLFQKQSGATIEVFCLNKCVQLSGELYESSNYRCNENLLRAEVWECLVGHLKKWNKDLVLKWSSVNFSGLILEAILYENNSPGSNPKILFRWNDYSKSFSQILEIFGNIPLPPYLNRKSEPSDYERYQTVYACNAGSVAAPTAGLHFTTIVEEKLCAKEIQFYDITLHVGEGTFKPITATNILNHEMHSEHATIDLKILQKLIHADTPIIAVGTTSLRTIESLYWLGVKFFVDGELSFYVDQFQPDTYKEHKLPGFRSIFQMLYEEFCKLSNNSDHISPETSISFETRLMIKQGYSLRVFDALLTNFHQPGSTLILLVSAIIGENWRNIYEYALNNDFRFLSYGDSSLLWKSDQINNG